MAALGRCQSPCTFPLRRTNSKDSHEDLGLVQEGRPIALRHGKFINDPLKTESFPHQLLGDLCFLGS